MAEIMVRFDDLRRYCEKRHCGCVPLEYIKQMPTIEAEPVRHGRWFVKGQEIYCSECNRESLYNSFGASKFSDFCPHCGVRMDGGVDNADT